MSSCRQLRQYFCPFHRLLPCGRALSSLSVSNLSDLKVALTRATTFCNTTSMNWSAMFAPPPCALAFASSSETICTASSEVISSHTPSHATIRKPSQRHSSWCSGTQLMYGSTGVSVCVFGAMVPGLRSTLQISM